jgi:hypothetical protein
MFFSFFRKTFSTVGEDCAIAGNCQLPSKQLDISSPTLQL